VRFEDLGRQPYRPADGDIHHRNEKLSGTGDAWLLAHGARRAGVWTIAARLGVSIPFGRTEPNPFDLGRRGIPHEHLQFGTGTWDPLVGLAVGRRVGATSLNLFSFSRFVLAANDHGYRAGRRHELGLAADRRLAGAWRGLVSLDLARDEAETWGGRIEEEGNLGRTDLLVSLGVGRALPHVGALTLTLRVPLLTRANGAQLRYPVIVAFGVTR
jgi:hypothetical protein